MTREEKRESPGVNLKNSVIYRSAMILSEAERRRILFITALQIFLSLLDLIGIAAVGMLGALAARGVGSQGPGDRVSRVLEALGLLDNTLQFQSIVLGCLAAGILVSKTLINIYFNRRITFFLSRRGAVLSSRLISKILSQSLVQVQNKSAQETFYLVTSGIDTITMGILNVVILLIADSALLLILLLGLFSVDPIIAISSLLIFGLVALLLYKLLEIRSKEIGDLQAKLSIQNSEKTLEILNSYREMVVRNRRGFYAREIGIIRMNLANTLAERQFMPNISKYIMEITVVLGCLFISALQFIINDAARAVATLTIFFAASTRIAPALLRFQQSALQIKNSLGSAEPTLDLIEQLRLVEPIDDVDDRLISDHQDFSPAVCINNLSFSYSNPRNLTIKSLSLDIKPGQVVAIVGSSGAGKTTLVDLILGILTPDSGEITINGKAPLVAISDSPGAIGYVPQDVLISNGTFRTNIALGYNPEFVKEELLINAIKIAHLEEVVYRSSSGLDTRVGDRGTKLSGGQRQRLGIARAMLTNPKLLVLDEATSSLDGEIEAGITDAIQTMRGSVTVILIAHRLSTVRKADVVLYLDQGRLIAQGTFNEVRNLVPNFDYQANLMGL
jgi:ATP-binding cassette, subfamily B, bacterial PglK